MRWANITYQFVAKLKQYSFSTPLSTYRYKSRSMSTKACQMAYHWYYKTNGWCQVPQHQSVDIFYQLSWDILGETMSGYESCQQLVGIHLPVGEL